jgi:large subunit ribosomal protein L22
MTNGTEVELKVVRAKAKYLRVSPRKLRIVADLVRGMPVVEARRILNYSGKGGAEYIRRTVDSAVANAENADPQFRSDPPFGLTADELYVARIFVDEGPTLKRWMPRARGRATRIRKRTSHLTVELAEIPEEA